MSDIDTTPTSADIATVKAAADRLVRDFASSQASSYFAHFASDATFCFYTHSSRLNSRAEYEQLWSKWETEDGFAVVSCASSEQLVQLLGDTAIFSHAVDTVIRTRADGETALQERETIVFAKRDGEWIVVHEHLSPR